MQILGHEQHGTLRAPPINELYDPVVGRHYWIKDVCTRGTNGHRPGCLQKTRIY